MAGKEKAHNPVGSHEFANGNFNKPNNSIISGETEVRHMLVDCVPSIRQCMVCNRDYRHPWGWVIVMAAQKLVDLCPKCARAVRYGSPEDKEAFLNSLYERFQDQGRAK